MIKSILTAAALTVASTGVQAQVNDKCTTIENMYDTLSNRHGEGRVWLGQGEDHIMEIWANENTRTWTLIVLLPSGFSCIINEGVNYAVIQGGDPA